MMIKWLKPGENWDDIDRQVLTYGLGPKAFLMGGLPIDRAEELKVKNNVPPKRPFSPFWIILCPA